VRGVGRGVSALSAWGRLVVGSALVVGGCVAVVAISWAASSQNRVGASAVRGDVEAVVVDAGDGAVEIVGGGERPDILVRRTERTAFGRRPEIDREVRDGVLRLRSRCPSGVLTGCENAWRVTIPDNTPVTVRTGAGAVTLRGLRGSATVTTGSGTVRVREFCGFALEVRSDSGALEADTTCAPERLSLRSRSGDVAAVVPAGRYRLDADADRGAARVTGIDVTGDAPFELQALSGEGDVRVEGQE